MGAGGCRSGARAPKRRRRLSAGLDHPAGGVELTPKGARSNGERVRPRARAGRPADDRAGRQARPARPSRAACAIRRSARWRAPRATEQRPFPVTIEPLALGQDRQLVGGDQVRRLARSGTSGSGSLTRDRSSSDMATAILRTSAPRPLGTVITAWTVPHERLTWGVRASWAHPRCRHNAAIESMGAA
jgi:hypothetical protein